MHCRLRYPSYTKYTELYSEDYGKIADFSVRYDVLTNAKAKASSDFYKATGINPSWAEKAEVVGGVLGVYSGSKLSSSKGDYPKSGMDNYQRKKVGDSDYPNGAENNATVIPLKQQLSNEMLKTQGTKFDNIDVIARVDINGKIYVDTNQRARADKLADPNKSTLIADNIAQKPPLKNGASHPNSNMRDAHAEIGAIQQAYERGATRGKDMVIQVQGKDVCTFCRQDIALAAEKAGLNSITIHAIDNNTKLPKIYTWSPGQKAIRENKNEK